MAEFDGIVDQVVHDLLNLPEIGVNHLNIVGEGQVEVDILLLTRSLKGRRRVLDYPVDVEIRPV